MKDVLQEDKARVRRHYRQREQQVQRHRGTKQPDMLEEQPGVQSVVGEQRGGSWRGSWRRSQRALNIMLRRLRLFLSPIGSY